jgi:threo-3-hydroxy-L-aspartate ammonia-lyase
MDQLFNPTVIKRSTRLNETLKADVTLAIESLQPTGSFKIRAAANLVDKTPASQFIAASSGNFGQALALACKHYGRQCTIVMPDDSAMVKIEGVEHYGAKTILIDTKVESRAERLKTLAQEFPNACITNAYDHELIIEGNASLGKELAKLSPRPDLIIAPVGGGGLVSGIITGLQSENAKISVWGAEPTLANDAARSLALDQLVQNRGEPKTIADGARTISLGLLNWEIFRQHIAGIVTVTEDEIKRGVKLLFTLANVKAEPTAALPIGALLSASPKLLEGKRVCCVISGGNVDIQVYRSLLSE